MLSQKLGFLDSMCLWLVEEVLNKAVGAKISLIKWSQDWSPDPWYQVVQEVERGEGC
jgi:hypothetical protein